MWQIWLRFGPAGSQFIFLNISLPSLTAQFQNATPTNASYQSGTADAHGSASDLAFQTSESPLREEIWKLLKLNPSQMCVPRAGNSLQSFSSVLISQKITTLHPRRLADETLGILC